MFDINKIRDEFPMFKNNKSLIYFDNAATSFKPNTVIEEVNDYYSKYNCNIHRGDYDLSYKISKEYDDTRNTICRFINIDDPNCIVFTSGASASLNLIANGYGLKYLKQGDVILTTQAEHASNILPWFNVANKTGAQIKYIPMNEQGIIDLNAYEKLLSIGNVKLVSLAHVSNVLGIVNPIKKMSELAHKCGSLINIDGAQSVPHIKVDVKDLDLDFLSFSSHKMLGPSGVGVLYAKANLLEKMDTVNFGGGSNARFENDGSVILKEIPFRFESGTPCIEGVLGLRKAIEFLETIGMENVEKYDAKLTEYLLNKLASLENVTVYNKLSQCGIISFNINGIFAQDAASYLNKNGIAVRSGNHCAKILHNIIGVNETIRVSMYLYNTIEEIDRLVDVIKETTLEKCVESIL